MAHAGGTHTHTHRHSTIPHTHTRAHLQNNNNTPRYNSVSTVTYDVSSSDVGPFQNMSNHNRSEFFARLFHMKHEINLGTWCVSSSILACLLACFHFHACGNTRCRAFVRACARACRACAIISGPVVCDFFSGSRATSLSVRAMNARGLACLFA